MSSHGRTRELEAVLQALGAGITYPPTPDLKPAVLAALEPREPTSGRARRLQLAVVLILGLVLLVAAAVVAADRLGWLRQAGVSRGPQFSGDYVLMGLWRLDGHGEGPGAGRRLTDLTVDPAGRDLYVTQAPDHEWPWLGPQPELLRIPVGDPDSGALLDLEPLASERIWGKPLPSDSLAGLLDGVVPLTDGRLIALAGRWSETDRRRAYAAPARDQTATAIVQRAADGEWTPIVRLDELVRTHKSAPANLTHDGVSVRIAAATDRVWLLVIQPGPWFEWGGHDVRRYLWEVRDPDGDGRWDDAVSTAVGLPAGLKTERRGECCFDLLRVVEVAGRERLVLVTPAGTEPEGFRLQGDLLTIDDAAATGRRFMDAPIPDLFGSMEAGGFHVDAVGMADGSLQLVVTDWSRVGRISLLHPEHGSVDIGRGFSRISDIAVTRDGRIYVLQDDDTIHELSPRSPLGPQG